MVIYDNIIKLEQFIFLMSLLQVLLVPEHLQYQVPSGCSAENFKMVMLVSGY